MEREKRAIVRAPDLADWVLARGQRAFTNRDIAQLLDVPPDQVRRRLAAPRSRGEWVSPSRGLWIAVPSEYRLWGAPPAIDLIDSLMRHLDVDYYVGWLSAAALYGASHQAAQVFQVATSSPVRDRQVGRSALRFYRRTHVGHVQTRQHTVATGYVPVSTVATTMLDIAADVMNAGGISNAATVIVELAEHNDFDVADVVALAPSYPAAATRRIGWVLTRFGDRNDLEPLRQYAREATETPSRLNPVLQASGPVDDSWLIYVNDAEIEVEA